MPWSLKGSSMTLPFRKKNRYVINQPEPTYNVIYLGNVLTVMAKGEKNFEKPLAMIWKTHQARTRKDLEMKLSITRSGLKAETKEQGLTEYWSNRITFSYAPKTYPRLFCWIYKHQGRKMKPELRCHAVLCKKLTIPPEIAIQLAERLSSALQEYKREKMSNQNARLKNPLFQHLGQPKRRQMLSTGTNNFRPPIANSKSAPKLGMIEEDYEEDEDEEGEEEDLRGASLRQLFIPPGSVSRLSTASLHESEDTIIADDNDTETAENEDELVQMTQKLEHEDDDEEEEEVGDEDEMIVWSRCPSVVANNNNNNSLLTAEADPDTTSTLSIHSEILLTNTTTTNGQHHSVSDGTVSCSSLSNFTTTNNDEDHINNNGIISSYSMVTTSSSSSEDTTITTTTTTASTNSSEQSSPEIFANKTFPTVNRHHHHARHHLEKHLLEQLKLDGMDDDNNEEEESSIDDNSSLQQQQQLRQEQPITPSSLSSSSWSSTSASASVSAPPLSSASSSSSSSASSATTSEQQQGQQSIRITPSSSPGRLQRHGQTECTTDPIIRRINTRSSASLRVDVNVDNEQEMLLIDSNNPASERARPRPGPPTTTITVNADEDNILNRNNDNDNQFSLTPSQAAHSPESISDESGFQDDEKSDSITTSFSNNGDSGGNPKGSKGIETENSERVLFLKQQQQQEQQKALLSSNIENSNFVIRQSGNHVLNIEITSL